MATYPQQQQERQGRSKWVLGCCLGCAGLLLAGGVAVGLILYFLLKSSPVLPPETFLTANADAFLIVRASAEDRGMVAVLEEYAKNLAENPPPGLAQDQKQRRQMEQQVRAIAERLDMFLPLQLVLTARHTDEEGEFSIAGAVAVKHASGMVRLLIKRIVLPVLVQEGGRTEDYEDVTIGVRRDGWCVAALENNILLAQDVQTVKDWIARIQEQKKLQKEAAEGESPVLPYGGAPLLQAMYERLDRGAAVRFATLNEHGEIGAFLASDGKQRPEMLEVMELLDITSAEVMAAGGSFKFEQTGDTGRCDLFVECADEAFAEGLVARIEALGEERAEEAGLQDLMATREGTLVKVGFRLPGIQNFLMEMSEK